MADKFDKDSLTKKLARIEAKLSVETNLLGVRETELAKEKAGLDEIRDVYGLKVKSAEAATRMAEATVKKLKEDILNLTYESNTVKKQLAENGGK